MDLEAKAREQAKDPEWVRKRLLEAKKVLVDSLVREFQDAEFDSVNHRLVSKGGYVLQWRVRMFPDEPISPDNQQTSVGTVVLVFTKDSSREGF